MAVSKAPEPVPALGNRLLPMESELTPGDAAPIYLRLAAGVTADSMSQLQSKPKTWLELPFDKFPAEQARLFLDGWRAKLEQLSFGANRATCSWNYTISEESEHISDLVLPDAQSMRSWPPLLALECGWRFPSVISPGQPEPSRTGCPSAAMSPTGPFSSMS